PTVPGQRARRHAAAGRSPRGPPRGARARSPVGLAVRAGGRRDRLVHRAHQRAAVPDHPPLSDVHVRGLVVPARRRRGDAMNAATWLESMALQLLHTLLVVAVAPALTGVVRLVKSRLTGKRGAPIWQPYRDIWRLLRKEAVVAESASWLFRVAP